MGSEVGAWAAVGLLLKVVMKLALVGEDVRALAVVEAAVNSGRGSLEWRSEMGAGGAASMALAAPVRDDWESVADGTADVVVLSASDSGAEASYELIERRTDRLRLLAQAGSTVAVARAEALGPIACFEMDMIRASSDARIVADMVDRLHPAIERLRELIDKNADDDNKLGATLGEIEQVVIERGVADRRAPRVLERLARDVDLVRALGGDVTRLSAVGAPANLDRERSRAANDDRDFAGLTVHLTAARFDARWSIDRDAADGDGRVVVFGALGRATLTMIGRQWLLSIVRKDGAESSEDIRLAQQLVATSNASSAERTATIEFDAWRPDLVWLAQIDAAQRGEAFEPDWLDVARAVDAADMVEVSLKRGRTIELYNENYTEQGTFKGVMGIAGCGLLLLALGVLVGAAIGQKAARLAGFDGIAEVLGNWHYAVLALLVVFLGLQLFRFAAPPAKRATRPPTRPPANE